jgi:hypothetical protein
MLAPKLQRRHTDKSANNIDYTSSVAEALGVGNPSFFIVAVLISDEIRINQYQKKSKARKSLYGVLFCFY